MLYTCSDELGLVTIKPDFVEWNILASHILAEQAGLNFTWLGIPKTGFLASRPKW